MSKKRKLEFQVEGMKCSSCEVVLEDKFEAVPGVKSAKVNFSSGKAMIYCDRNVELQQLQDAVSADGYGIVAPGLRRPATLIKNTRQDYLEIGAVVLVIFGLYELLSGTNILNFGIGISQNMSYGLIFLIGLVAASSSCITVSGGVLLSVAAKYNESVEADTKAEKFAPHLLFNIGRIVSYTLLGGVLGMIGSTFRISSTVTGVVAIIASFFMILMGLKILKLFPALNKIGIRMPKFITKRILNAEGRPGKIFPFSMGALTFFLPCGFTQSLQLYAISKGSFIDGALIMFFFSLGTLPALLSLGAVSSFAKGSFQRYFLKFSGVLVLVLGFFNISNGLALAGVNLSSLTTVFAGPENTLPSGDVSVPFIDNALSTNPVAQSSANSAVQGKVKLENGKQIAEMKLVGYQYIPSQFTVQKGVPVEWRIDGSQAEGCGQVLVAPKLGVTEFLPQDQIRIISFTPEEEGDIPFNCSMGMMTRGAAFHVVSKI